MLNLDFIFVALSSILIFSFWVFVFIIFYHLVRFGIGTQPKLGSLVFVFGSFTLFFLSVFFFSNIDWKDLSKQLSGFAKDTVFITLTTQN